jgi:hypothetical protein
MTPLYGFLGAARLCFACARLGGRDARALLHSALGHGPLRRVLRPSGPPHVDGPRGASRHAHTTSDNKQVHTLVRHWGGTLTFKQWLARRRKWKGAVGELVAYLKHEWNGVLAIFEFIGKALYQVFEKTLLVVVTLQAVVLGIASLGVTLGFVWVWFPFLAAIAAIAPPFFLYCQPRSLYERTQYEKEELGRRTMKDLVWLMIWWAVVALCVFAWSFTVP